MGEVCGRCPKTAQMALDIWRAATPNSSAGAWLLFAGLKPLET